MTEFKDCWRTFNEKHPAPASCLGGYSAPVGIALVVASIIILALTEQSAVNRQKLFEFPYQQFVEVDDCVPGEYSRRLVALRDCVVNSSSGARYRFTTDGLLKGMHLPPGTTVPTPHTKGEERAVAWRRTIERYQCYLTDDGSCAIGWSSYRKVMSREVAEKCSRELKVDLSWCTRGAWPQSFSGFDEDYLHLEENVTVHPKGHPRVSWTLPTSIFLDHDRLPQVTSTIYATLHNSIVTVPFPAPFSGNHNNLCSTMDQTNIAVASGPCSEPGLEWRIKWKLYTLSRTISVIGEQSGDTNPTLKAWSDPMNHREVAMMAQGSLSGGHMLHTLYPTPRASALSIVARIAGWLGLWVGMQAMLSWAVLTPSLPLLGRCASLDGLRGGSQLLLSQAAATLTALLTIGFSWIILRPMLAVPLGLGLSAVAGGVHYIRRSYRPYTMHLPSSSAAHDTDLILDDDMVESALGSNVSELDSTSEFPTARPPSPPLRRTTETPFLVDEPARVIVAPPPGTLRSALASSSTTSGRCVTLMPPGTSSASPPTSNSPI